MKQYILRKAVMLWEQVIHIKQIDEIIKKGYSTGKEYKTKNLLNFGFLFCFGWFFSFS